MATISDVARASGVSPATVSFVLNNGPRPVSAKTRERVLAAMERLNYHPSAVARGLARQRMYTLGVLFSGHNPRIVQNAYAASVLDGIVAAATARGYNVTLITRHWDAASSAADAAKSAQVVCDGRTDGIVILTPLAGADAALGTSSRGTPLVQVGAPAVLPSTVSVDIDNRAGARMAARHLLERGHRRFILLLGPPEYEHVGERRDAYLEELGRAGTAPPAGGIVAGFHGMNGAERERVLRKLLLTGRSDERPTALLATSDALAIDAVRVARALGISVPEQLSVVGFDDAPGSGAEAFGLTTVRQPLFEMGETAALRLIDRIESPGGAAERERGDTAGPIVFAPALTVRGSTAEPPRP